MAKKTITRTGKPAGKSAAALKAAEQKRRKERQEKRELALLLHERLQAVLERGEESDISSLKMFIEIPYSRLEKAGKVYPRQGGAQ